jgi:drug/metabolite transporter (DMT)-like permease
VHIQRKSSSLFDKVGNRHSLAIAAIIMCTALWGLSFISSKSLLIAGLTPIQIISARFTLATVVFLGLYLTRRFLKYRHDKGSISDQYPQHHPLTPDHSNSRGFMVKAALAAVVGIPVYFLLEVVGLRFTSAGTASLIIGLTPVINAIILLAFFKTGIARFQWMGIIMSCLGVYIVAQADINLSISGTTMIGNLLIFLSACSWVIFTMMNKPLISKYDNLTINTYQHLVGTIILLLLAIFKGGIPFARWNLWVWINILYLGIFCSALGFFLYLFALKSLSSTVITSFINLVPFVSILGARVFLGEPISWVRFLGGTLTIAGVYTVSSLKASSTQTLPCKSADAR